MSRTVGSLLLLAVAALAGPALSWAQAPGKVHRVGYLAYLPCARVLEPGFPFLDGLRARGWVVGENLVVECRDAIGHFDRLPALAAELVSLGLDALVTEGTPQTVAGKAATTTVPIVMVGVGDPVGNGLVESLARPGGNVTGAAMFPTVDLVVKGLELLRQIAPSVVRVAVVWDPENRALVSVDEQLDKASRPLGLEIRRLRVQTPADVDAALVAVHLQGAHALLVHPLPVGPAGARTIFEGALARRLPVLVWWEGFAPMPGVLLSYGPRLADMYGRAAGLVDRVMRGAHPRDLPVELPSTFSLIVNRSTARALGLALPPALLLRADRVID